MTTTLTPCVPMLIDQHVTILRRLRSGCPKPTRRGRQGGCARKRIEGDSAVNWKLSATWARESDLKLRLKETLLKLTIRQFVPAVFLTASLVPTGAWAVDAAAGKAVFDAKCKNCHGASGEGNPNIAK